MHVGIDVSLLLYPAVAGMRLYLVALLEALLAEGPQHRWGLFYHTRRSWGGVGEIERFAAANVHLVPAPAPVRMVPDSAWWLGFDPPLRWMTRERFDVFHAGDFLFPRSPTTPMVATLFDLTPELFPELHVAPNRVRHRRQMAWAARRASRLIAISQATADDFGRLFPSPVPIDVIHPGTRRLPSADSVSADAIAAIRTRLGVGSDRLVLCVGTVEPRKNTARLIEAFGRVALDPAHPAADVRLVLAGRRGWRSEAAYRAAAASPIAGRIHFAEDVEDVELAALYATAEVFAYPSLYEGFGLPVVEAMQAGLPVLTSTVSSLPEAAGGAAVLVDPADTDAIARGLADLLSDANLRARLSAAGRGHARTLTWASAARRTLRTYRLAAQSRRRPPSAERP
ncbi:MAG: glycosyl transferase, group 1 [Gemmatimonadetes bacterium]|nr:glycosyl transferase, group 1 [Gemmatimonadota bacterium]